MQVLVVLFALVLAASAQQFCSPCQEVIGMIESYITENTTETEILQALENLCNLVPGSFGTQCAQAVAQNGPAIIQDMINEEPPKVCCTQLGLCTTQRAKHVDGQVDLTSLREVRRKMKAQKAALPFDNCDLCKTVISYVSAWVASNHTEAQIESAINKYCPLLGLPPSECTAIANKVPEVVAEIENGATPSACCQTLGLCPQRANVASTMAKKKVAAKLRTKRAAEQNADCSICVFAVGQIEDYIASNATETQIENELNVACGFLGSFQAQCQAVVANLPAYIAQLEKAEDPTTICTQVGICTSNVPRPKPHFSLHRPKKN